MLALVNWPTFAGINEQVPSEALPLVTRDHLCEYFKRQPARFAAHR